MPPSPPPEMFVYLDGDVRFFSMWCKYVRAVDLDVHCINALIGQRHRPVAADADYQRLTLDQHIPAPAYYLCAVSTPYRWQRNGHVLALPADGEEHEVDRPGLGVILLGLRPVPITDLWLPGRRYHHDRLFVTCRNLQAAWWLHRELGLPRRYNPDRDTAPPQAGPRRIPRQPRLW